MDDRAVSDSRRKIPASVTGSFRLIALDDLRDAIESLVTIWMSDDELAERGLQLTEHVTLREGLGPSSFAVIELVTGTQYLLERLDHDPAILWVVAPLIDDSTPLAASFVEALDVPDDRLG